MPLTLPYMAQAAIQSMIPTAASAMPPGIGVSGAKGAEDKSFARADHTHASSVQRQRVTITLLGSTGKGVWTFPTPYAAGVIPVVETTVETPDSAAYAYDAKILAGSVNNAQCTVVVNKFNSSVTLPSVVTSLLGLVIGLFAPATGQVTVHCWAALPTS